MKNRILMGVILLLGVLAGYLYVKEKPSTIKEERRDFAVKDTASISKIFLVDKAQKSVTLTRVNKGRWKVNEKYFARRDLINVLLKTINGLKVKSPVSRSSRNNVVTRLASGATKVEIYQGTDVPAKVYYVGGATQNTMGTYMLLEGSSEAFITHLPSFFGYLSTRYVTHLDLWRDKTFVDHQFKDIQRVQIEFPGDPTYSFSIVNKGNWDFELNSLHNDSVVEDYDTVGLRVYLTGFQDIQFEGFEKEKDQQYIDSIFESRPVHTLTVETIDGQTNYVQAYLKPDEEDRLDINGEPMLYDVDRLYARINGGKELVTIQYYVFDNIILGLPDFLKGTAKARERLKI
jgi:hypothetical protein